MVDIFTKFTQGVPLKSKSIQDVVDGMKECLKLIGKTPKSMYMDSEGAFVSKEMKEYFESININLFTQKVMHQSQSDKSAQPKNCYTGVSNTMGEIGWM